MIKTNKPVTVAALLLVLCILPGATNINLGYPRKFKFVADRVSFEQSVAAPVAFVALSRGLDSELVRNSIKILAMRPLKYSAASPWHEVNSHSFPSGHELYCLPYFPVCGVLVRQT
jgi:membrane-associated phospholipid phosphatase